jgi:hypothetical protein
MADQEPNEQKSERKVHVDEDWKQSVQEEKERLRQEQQAGAQAEPSGADQGPAEPQNLPEPSVQALVADFYQQALVSLGVIENPITGEKTRVPQVASYLIDMIDMLHTKMEGNLTENEEKYMTNVLHDLRMRYINSEPEQSSGEGAEPPEDGP